MVCLEAMVNQEIDEYYLSLCSNAIHLSTDVRSGGWSNVLSVSMCDNLLRSGVGVHLTIAVTIGGIVGVDADFIVIALGVEAKPAD